MTDSVVRSVVEKTRFVASHSRTSHLIRASRRYEHFVGALATSFQHKLESEA